MVASGVFHPTGLLIAALRPLAHLDRSIPFCDIGGGACARSALRPNPRPSAQPARGCRFSIAAGSPLGALAALALRLTFAREGWLTIALR